MKKNYLSILAVFVILLAGCTMGSSDDPSVDAIKSSQEWLALVDGGNFGEGWDTASAAYRSTVTRKRAINILRDARNTIGKVVSRELISKEHVMSNQSLPRPFRSIRPEGEYFLLIYATVYEDWKSPAEITLMRKEVDGKWRLDVYYVE